MNSSDGIYAWDESMWGEFVVDPDAQEVTLADPNPSLWEAGPSPFRSAIDTAPFNLFESAPMPVTTPNADPQPPPDAGDNTANVLDIPEASRPLRHILPKPSGILIAPENPADRPGNRGPFRRVLPKPRGMVLIPESPGLKKHTQRKAMGVGKRKVNIACSGCRQSRVKCTGNNGTGCQRCQKSGNECIFVPTRRQSEYIAAQAANTIPESDRQPEPAGSAPTEATFLSVTETPQPLPRFEKPTTYGALPAVTEATPQSTEPDWSLGGYTPALEGAPW